MLRPIYDLAHLSVHSLSVCLLHTPFVRYISHLYILVGLFCRIQFQHLRKTEKVKKQLNSRLCATRLPVLATFIYAFGVLINYFRDEQLSLRSRLFIFSFVCTCRLKSRVCAHCAQQCPVVRAGVCSARTQSVRIVYCFIFVPGKLCLKIYFYRRDRKRFGLFVCTSSFKGIEVCQYIPVC